MRSGVGIDQGVELVVDRCQGLLGLAVETEEVVVEGLALRLGLGAGGAGHTDLDRRARIGEEADPDGSDQGCAEGGTVITGTLPQSKRDNARKRFFGIYAESPAVKQE